MSSLQYFLPVTMVFHWNKTILILIISVSDIHKEKSNWTRKHLWDKYNWEISALSFWSLLTKLNQVEFPNESMDFKRA